ncbi:putative sulfate exporter family transporter [Rhizobium sp. 18065]|uniref:YeiH family protein n=1 Tax=Rhizobium sp. 18065 TaxID=2681411 RepID=UPI001FCEDD8C|nr:putative sulfate exporter family transporter [Rhizobium sp. 18065]
MTFLIALASAFLSEHYGAPAMLLAILIGLALHFLAEDPKTARGLDFASRTMLRLGIALLGLKVSVGMFAELGIKVMAMIVASVVMTILFGLLASRLSGQGSRFGFLTGGAVAICGASAAMAISAALGGARDRDADQQMVFVVIGVTMLSTLAMIFYPILASQVGLDDFATGIFLGATIHDVAQVAGAGFSVSGPAGETAVFVKLIRVTLLAPVVLVAAIVFRRGLSGTETVHRPPLLPAFVIVFLALASLNSLVTIPAAIANAAGEISRWSLLVAIAAVGVKTSLPEVFGIGRRAIGLLIGETVFLAVLVLSALTFAKI